MSLSATSEPTCSLGVGGEGKGGGEIRNGRGGGGGDVVIGHSLYMNTPLLICIQLVHGSKVSSAHPNDNDGHGQPRGSDDALLGLHHV